MAASAASRELFKEGVRAVLHTWPVLQIAVDNGFGGIYGQQKADWMVDVVQQYFHDNADLQPYEVEDFIAQLMDQEFDTVVDDGSLPQRDSETEALSPREQTSETSACRVQIREEGTDFTLSQDATERAESSDQDSAVHLHLKDEGHSSQDNNVHSLSRETDGLKEERKKRQTGTSVTDRRRSSQVSIILMQVFSQWQQGALQQLKNTINTLTQKQSQRAKVTAPPTQSEDNSDAETQAMDCESSSPSVSGTDPPPPLPQDEEDGWTVVRKKK